MEKVGMVYPCMYVVPSSVESAFNVSNRIHVVPINASTKLFTIRNVGNLRHHLGKVFLYIEPSGDPGAPMRTSILVEPLKLHRILMIIITRFLPLLYDYGTNSTTISGINSSSSS